MAFVLFLPFPPRSRYCEAAGGQECCGLSPRRHNIFFCGECLRSWWQEKCLLCGGKGRCGEGAGIAASPRIIGGVPPNSAVLTLRGDQHRLWREPLLRWGTVVDSICDFRDGAPFRACDISNSAPRGTRVTQPTHHLSPPTTTTTLLCRCAGRVCRRRG